MYILAEWIILSFGLFSYSRDNSKGILTTFIFVEFCSWVCLVGTPCLKGDLLLWIGARCLSCVFH